jgi:hypothetical protein
VDVEAKGVAETISTLANIKDVIELVAMILAAFIAIKRYVLPSAKKAQAAAAYPQQGYYANQYYGGQYYGAGGAWRGAPTGAWGPQQAGGWGAAAVQPQAPAAAAEAKPKPPAEEPVAKGLHPELAKGPSGGLGLHPGDEGAAQSGAAKKKADEAEDLDRGLHP